LWAFLFKPTITRHRIGRKKRESWCNFERPFQEGRFLSNLLIYLAMDNEEVEPWERMQKVTTRVYMKWRWY
jgi:hypothetical protein